MAGTHDTAHRFACQLRWSGASQGGTTSYEDYSRELLVETPGKPDLRMSAAPAFVGDPSIHNPEDLLVASLAACHCLSYLALCARSRITVLSYEDDASGTMDQVERVTRFTEVVLRPRVTVAPGTDLVRARLLHDKAHRGCFIASSVSFPVRHEPTITVAS